MIKTLEIQNWRTHHDTKLDFGKGTNAIIGVMGSGKSSIINAISYGFFGTFPGLKSKQVSLNEVIMNKPNQCEEATIKLVFENNEKEYKVERLIKLKGTNEAKLFEGNMLIAGPKQKNVNEKIEKILGLDYELFSRAVYAEQNEMDFFLKLSPSERKKKFDELLDLEKYEKARKNTISLKNQLLKDGAQLEKIIQTQKETTKEYELEKILEKIKEEEEKIKEIEEKKKELEKKFLEKKEKVKKLEEEEKIHEELKEIITREKSKIESLEESISKKKEEKIEKVKEELEEIKKKINEIKKNKEKTLEDKKNSEKENNLLKEEKRIINYRLEEIKKEKQEIEKLEGKCPKCKSELTKEHKEKILKELDSLSKELNEKKEKSEEIIEKNVKKIKEEEEKIKEIDGEIDKNNKIVFETEQRLKNLEEIEEQKKELEKKKIEIKKNIEKIEKINFDKKYFEEQKKDFLEIKYVVENINERINNKKELKKSYEETVQKIRQIENNTKILEKEFLKKKNASEKLGIFENCLSSTQKELREVLLENINEAMSQTWEKIYPYEDLADARLRVSENGYELEVQTRTGNWVRVEGILSGGERSAAALCIRIAFSLVLTKQLSLLILDEPTHNLDTNAVEKLANMLSESLPKIVEQIFVITHDKEMEKAGSGKNNNLYILERDKNKDGATRARVLTTSEII